MIMTFKGGFIYKQCVHSSFLHMGNLFFIDFTKKNNEDGELDTTLN